MVSPVTEERRRRKAGLMNKIFLSKLPIGSLLRKRVKLSSMRFKGPKRSERERKENRGKK
jgi:hypothetical protein